MISKKTTEGKAFWKIAAEVKEKMQTWPAWKCKHILKGLKDAALSQT